MWRYRLFLRSVLQYRYTLIELWTSGLTTVHMYLSVKDVKAARRRVIPVEGLPCRGYVVEELLGHVLVKLGILLHERAGFKGHEEGRVALRLVLPGQGLGFSLGLWSETEACVC